MIYEKLKNNMRKFLNNLKYEILLFLFIKQKKYLFVLVLKISKKELDRQRAKGLNHNPTRISQIENQIRQYEYQLNDIKRRLESIEV